jgi:hypothetical protein
MLCTTYTNVWSIICPLYPERKYIINNWGLMKKKYFWWSGVYFIFNLHLYITVTCRHTCTIVFYGKDCFSNIKTSSKCLEYLNIFPSFFKKFNTSWNQFFFILLMLKLISNSSIRIWRYCDVMSVICFLYFVEFSPRYFDGFRRN